MTSITIKTSGYLLNSPYPERREFCVETDPPIDLADTLSLLLEAKKQLLMVWRPRFPRGWWVDEVGCPLCRERRSSAARRGVLTRYSEWKEGYCPRHAAVRAISVLSVVDNKERRMAFERRAGEIVAVKYETHSHKHRLELLIAPEEARIVFDGRVFLYRNHLNSYPFASSYARICEELSRVIETLRSVLTSGEVDLNVFYNGEPLRSASTRERAIA